MDHIPKNDIEEIVVSIDAEKAFSLVNWNFLIESYTYWASMIIKSIQALYDNHTARIEVNGHLSNSFTLERGCRHGFAWSPQFFALFLEPLAQYIRQNKDIKGITIKETKYKLACYADDILVYFGQPTYFLPKSSCDHLSSIVSYQGTKLV